MGKSLGFCCYGLAWIGSTKSFAELTKSFWGLEIFLSFS